MAEYEDELADNSDDEKRLFRAEGSAGRKLKRKVRILQRRRVEFLKDTPPTSLGRVPLPLSMLRAVVLLF